MYSQLFRSETARRLRNELDSITEAYYTLRLSWLNRYREPSRDGVRAILSALADAVEQNDPEPFCDFAAEQLMAVLDSDIPPVAILAAGDLLCDTLLAYLTPDQTIAVREILEMERAQRLVIIYERVMKVPRQKGA